MATRVGVRGSRELAAALRELGRSPTAAGRRRGRTAAAKVLQDAARFHLQVNASVETGALSAALTVAEDDGRRNRTLMGVRKGKIKGRIPSSYSHLVEFGTAPHWQPNRFGGIMHPGARPKPYMRPAYEQNIHLASRAYFMEIKADVEAAAVRIARRAPRRAS